MLRECQAEQRRLEDEAAEEVCARARRAHRPLSTRPALAGPPREGFRRLHSRPVRGARASERSGPS
eukprot:309692-Prymnesium_polylepis.1